jgi:hypothetical protein
VEAGPIIVTRAGHRKIAVLGFHPALSAMRYEWRRRCCSRNCCAGCPRDLPPQRDLGASVWRRQTGHGTRDGCTPDVKVTGDDGSLVPFTMRDRTLNFFSAAAGGVKGSGGDREYLYSLTLPELWDSKWTPPAEARSGVPKFAQVFEERARSVALARDSGWHRAAGGVVSVRAIPAMGAPAAHA